ncbi:MAG: Smr/MutS family protein [Steroidobacteraceae bacterium]
MKRPTEDEASLFRDSVRGVKRLPASERLPGPRKPSPRARYPRTPHASASEGGSRPARPDGRTLEAGDALRYSRPHAPRSLLRELRRARLRPQAEVDLHGLSAARAERALQDFLREAIERGLRCVRIVHGKGRHSGTDGPVLKNLVDAALRRTSAVLAFASAPPAEGGTGAVHVLLAR